MDMDFLTSNDFYRKACTSRPWQKSMDCQQFGFAPSLLNSMEVAPADELFFNGKLLPLQFDHRLHIVQALSCEEAPSSSLYVSQDEEAPTIKDHDNPSFDRAPPICHRSATPGPMLSLCCIDEETKEPWLSYWHRDEEIVINSCRIEGDSGIGNSMMDPQSSSFRSQSSGFWDSGVDKDMGDSSSSSRDSNGSSQDSYLPHNTALEAPACPPAPHGFHAKASFHIPWKSFLKKASNKAATSFFSSSPLTISRTGYPEDGSEYKDGFPYSLKELSLPWKPEAYAEKSRSNQDEKGKSKGITTSWVRSKYLLCKAAEEDVIAHMGQGGRNDEYEKEELKRKQQRSATNKSSTHNTRKTNIRKETSNSMLPTSMSTMHEVQSALQSAIAHCKESMREA